MTANMLSPSEMIYTSPYKPMHLPRRSIFTHLLGASTVPGIVGGFPAHYLAFIDAASGTSISRGMLRTLCLQLAHSLLHPPPALAPPHNRPVRTPPTVLIFSPNTLAWPVMLLGVAAAGYRATLANSAYTPAELAHQYTDSQAHFVFAYPPLVPVVRDMMRSIGLDEHEIRRRIVVADTTWLTGAPELEAGEPATLNGLTRLSDLIGRGELAQEVAFPGALADSTVYLCYSSGTTGKPKGVESTHFNITSVLEILRPVFPSMKAGPLRDAKKKGEVIQAYQDALFGVLPFYHIYGAIKLLQFPLSQGVPSVILAKFDPDRFCAAVEKYRPTIGLIVPPILVVFAKHPAVEKYDMSSLDTLFSGAAPLGADLVSAVRQRFLKRGNRVIITQGYGLTETSPTMLLLPKEHAVAHVGSTGFLMPNLEARLVSEENGEKTTDIPGAGELWVRGPTVMKGYLNNPAATQSSITPDGWFKTGDIAVRDQDGFYTIVDRRKELIKYKGFQVPPAELESVLLQHPQIADAAVIGVENKEEATELPRAYVVKTTPDDASLTPEAVQDFVAGRVAPHKKLRGGVVFLDAIPKSAAGKILRRELRERAKSEGAGQERVRAKL